MKEEERMWINLLEWEKRKGKEGCGNNKLGDKEDIVHARER